MRDTRKLLSVLALVASLWIVPSAHGQTFDFKQKLVPPGGQLSAEFGITVAIDGAVAVVGAPEDTVSMPGGEGSARVFVNVAGTWTLAQTLVNAGGSFADEFGRSVAISGNTIVVGAPGVTVQTGAPGQGAAYVFVWNGATWAQQARLVAADGGGASTLAPRSVSMATPSSSRRRAPTSRQRSTPVRPGCLNGRASPGQGRSWWRRTARRTTFLADRSRCPAERCASGRLKTIPRADRSTCSRAACRPGGSSRN